MRIVLQVSGFLRIETSRSQHLVSVGASRIHPGGQSRPGGFWRSCKMTDRNRLRKPLSEKICDLRMMRGLTQKQLAARAGLSEDGFKGVEQGRRVDPRFSTVLRIADALGVTLDELITEDEPLEE